MGHLKGCWDAYGGGHPQGMLGLLTSEALGPRYSVSERRWTQMLAGAEDGGPGPSPRSFHAAAYVPAGRSAMYLLGGLTAGGVTRDFWVLNLTTLQWRQEKVSISPIPSPHIRALAKMVRQLLPASPSEEMAFSQGSSTRPRIEFHWPSWVTLYVPAILWPRGYHTLVGQVGYSLWSGYSQPYVPSVRVEEQGLRKGAQAAST